VTRGFSILEDLQVQEDFCVTHQFSKKVTEFLCTHMYNYYLRNSGLQIKLRIKVKHMKKDENETRVDVHQFHSQN